MNPVTRKRYTPEFKAQAVELVALGKPVPEVAQDFGLSSSLLYKWVGRNPQPGQLGGPPLSCPGCDAKSPTSNSKTTF